MYGLMKYEPFRSLRSLDSDLNRLFGFENEGFTTWQPSVDVWETDNEVVAEVECAGLSPEDLNISVENGTLRITGEKKAKNENRKGNYHRVERTYGKFMRSFSLPSSVDAENISAEYKDGVVKVSMPKQEAAKAKTIEIKSADAPKALAANAGGI